MLLQAQDITVRMGGVEVLSRVSMGVEAGEIVTVLGPNGSGKSTLLRAVLGMVPLAGGQVTRAEGLRLGYVPQKLAIDPSLPLTVRRFLSLPHRVSDEEAADALARVGMDAAGQRQIAALSGGQLQRVMLARALLGSALLALLILEVDRLTGYRSACICRAAAGTAEVRAGLQCLLLCDLWGGACGQRLPSRAKLFLEGIFKIGHKII